MIMCRMHECACVCACVRACVRACVCVCVKLTWAICVVILVTEEWENLWPQWCNRVKRDSPSSLLQDSRYRKVSRGEVWKRAVIIICAPPACPLTDHVVSRQPWLRKLSKRQKKRKEAVSCPILLLPPMHNHDYGYPKTSTIIMHNYIPHHANKTTTINGAGLKVYHHTSSQWMHSLCL